MKALSPKQLASAAHATAAVNVWDGAIRSGKTVSSCLAFMNSIVTAPRGHIAVFGKTRDTIGRNVLSTIEDLEPMAIKWRQGAPTCRIMGRTCYVIGANDAQAEQKVRGLTLVRSYLDEGTLVNEQFFQTLLGRGSGDDARLYLTTNPDSPNHWLKRLYLDRIKDLPDWRWWHFTMDDNPGLSEARKERYRRELVGLWFRRMVQGEWVAAEGAIFDMWDEKVHVKPWASMPQMLRLFGIGVDFGSQHPSSAMMLGLGDDGNLWFVDEWRHDTKIQDMGLRMTVAGQASSMLQWLNRPHTPQGAAGGYEPTVEWIAHDPAAAALRDELFDRGLMNVMAATNEVTPGIQLMASLLGTQRLFVSDRCKGFITEAPGYSWDPKANLLGVDKPIKAGDDSLDAGRYAVASTQNLWRSLIRAA